MQKYLILIMTDSETPADRGRMITALQLASDLSQKTNELRIMFAGKAVTWLPKFIARNEESHPFFTNYGPKFDSIRKYTEACNMCTKRFDVLDTMQKENVPIYGEGKEHAHLGKTVLEGAQVITF